MRSTIVVALLVIAALGSSVAFAGDEDRSRYSGSYLNGRGWLTLDDASQLAYVQGLLDGMVYAAHVIVRKSKEPEEYEMFTKSEFPRGRTMGEIRKGIDLIYADPANMNVAVIFAVEAFKARAEGAPKAVTDKYLEEARKIAHDVQEDKERVKH